MAAAGITKRWVRGSLLITVLVILAAEVMFLYTNYRELYGGVQRAAESRFSTIAGRLQATGTAGDAMIFSEAELAVYGIFELQELERVLRGKDARAMREVADTIRAKIGRPVAEEDDVFLLSYYGQLKARLERKLLFGKRREDKYASD